MSRLAKKPIVLPKKVTAAVAGDEITIAGPLGSLTRRLPFGLAVAVDDHSLIIDSTSLPPEAARVLSGTYAAHLKNMILGVKQGFKKELILEGVGFKVALSGDKLTFSLGFSHPVIVTVPPMIKVVVDKNQLAISGFDKEALGEFAARLRDLKRPEPYKGKGIRYANEVVRRKQGKKVVA